MFLEDELAARRNRASRISISMLVAVVAVTASSLMISGLISAAHAEDARTLPSLTTTANDGHAAATGRKDFLQLAAAPIMASNAVSMTMPRAPSHADQQIMRGLSALLLALMATSGLAVWHRRFRGILGNGR